MRKIYRVLSIAIILIIGIGLFIYTHLNFPEPESYVTAAIKFTEPLLFENATIFTGDPNEAVLENANLLVNGGTIAYIGYAKPPGSYLRYDMKGKYIIPGLIDSHVHLYSTDSPFWFPMLANAKRAASAFLYAGVTTVVDLAGPLADLKALATQTEEAVPHIVYSGSPFTAIGGHPKPIVSLYVPKVINFIISHFAKFILEVDQNSPIEKDLSRNIINGASLTKIMVDEMPEKTPVLSEQSIKNIVSVSNKFGVTSIAHIGTEDDLEKCIKAGVRNFAHIPYRSSLDKSLNEIDSSYTFITTLGVWERSSALFNAKWQPSGFDSTLSDVRVIKANQHPMVTDKIHEEFKIWLEKVILYQDERYANLQKLRTMRANILVGTDSPGLGSMPGSALHQELELLVKKGGFTPIEAIAAATYYPGKWLSENTQYKNLGHLTIGAKADFVILNKDFRDNISATQDINSVWINGKYVERTSKNKE